MDWGKWFDRAISVFSLILLGLGTWFAHQSIPPGAQGSGPPLATTPLWLYASLLGVGVLLFAVSVTSLIHRRKSRPEFAQTRRDLDQKYPSVAARFGEDSSVWAMWAIGTRYFDAAEKLHVIKRLILPNPDSDVAKHYFGTIDQEHARPLITATTEKALRAGVGVRWSNHFPFHALTLIDPSKPSGWAHVEAALPYCLTERRPSYTITRARMPKAMDTFVHVFERVWQNSSEPPTIGETESAPLSAAPIPQSHTSLFVTGPYPLREHIYKNRTRWRMKVHNAGRASALNVQMKLQSGNPAPKDARWSADYPYPVFSVGSVADSMPPQINPTDVQDYEITCGWKNAGTQFITTLNTKNSTSNTILIEPDERWKLSYEVTAANADPVKFALELFVEGDDVKVVRAQP